jgi:S1-C subfamily serine protease
MSKIFIRNMPTKTLSYRKIRPARMSLSIFLTIFSAISFQAAGQNYSLEPNFGELELTAGFDDDPRVAPVYAGGPLDLSESTEFSCSGFVSEAPDYRIDYSTNNENYTLGIYAPAEVDTILLINTPNGDWHCNDDFNDEFGFTAGLEFESPLDGVYDIWVGVYDQNGIYSAAELYITELGEFETPNNISVTVPSTIADNSELLQAASGSGFAVSYEGYLVTNNHVIEGCENVRVHSLGTVIGATVISRDPINDLAILKADFRPTAIFALGDNDPELLQDIYVAGFPFGVNISSSVKVTKGIVSSLTGLGNNFSNIQIDAAIQPGNSGGPIFDDNGNVVGVAVATLDIEYALDRFETIPQNTNFGIKANIVSNLLSSNGVETSRPNTSSIPTTQLGQLATNATYYLSCWMTTAQIEQMSSTKVLFNGLGR